MKTKNMTVSVLAGALILALWYTMLLKPTRAKTSEVRTEVESQKNRLVPLERKLEQAQRDAAHAAEFKAQLESLQRAMPNSPALAAFIRDANGISDASGVSWQSVTHGPPTPGTNGSMAITVGIQVRGTYGQVLDYMSRLAALRRLVVVDSVQLSTVGTSGAAGGDQTAGGSTGPFTGSTELSATISARMFQSPAAALAAGVAAVPASSAAALNNS